MTWETFILMHVKWERAFIISCVAVFMDPLFLYIPVVDETKGCIAMDKTLAATVLILRSVTDFLVIFHIVAEYRGRVDTDYEISPQLIPKPGFDKEYDSDIRDDAFIFSLITKCLAIVPIPQVAILMGFFRLKGSNFVALTAILNIFLVLHYLPRVCQIYLCRNKFSTAGRWFKPAFNLFLYILASHVLGALWYFFAIERQTSCWLETCRKSPGCGATTFNCNGSSTKNNTMVNQHCSSSSTEFDFGMFAKLLQSGNTGSVGFPTKISYTLWWGIRNLSNFGTNLETSGYIWENCFAILICVIGLLLFIYLIGNMQMYMQLTTDQALKNEVLIQKRVAANKKKIMKWMRDLIIPDDVMTKFKTVLKERKVLEKEDMGVVDATYFQNDNFPKHIADLILVNLGMAQLKKVNELQRNNLTKYMTDLSRKMKPVVYEPNSSVFVPPELRERMFFVIRGEMVIEETNRTTVLNTSSYNYYGMDIPRWALLSSGRSLFEIPNFYKPNFKSGYGQKLEVLTLEARDLLLFLEIHGVFDRESRIEDEHVSYPDVRWERPPTGWWKLNCTALWDPITHLACLSFILRTDTGDFIAAGRTGERHCIDGFQAGALSLHDAMKHCVENLNLPAVSLVVELDDKLLVDMITSGALHSSYQVGKKVEPTLQDIRNLMISNYGAQIQLKHCQRQSNAAALVVAKHAMSAPAFKIWNTPECPDDVPGLRAALEKDSTDLQQSTQEQNQELGDDIGASTSAAAESHATTDEAEAETAAADDNL